MNTIWHVLWCAITRLIYLKPYGALLSFLSWECASLYWEPFFVNRFIRWTAKQHVQLLNADDLFYSWICSNHHNFWDYGWIMEQYWGAIVARKHIHSALDSSSRHAVMENRISICVEQSNAEFGWSRSQSPISKDFNYRIVQIVLLNL